MSFFEVADERFGNIRTVRAFGAEPKEERNYAQKIDVVLELAKKNALASAIFFGFVSG